MNSLHIILLFFFVQTHSEIFIFGQPPNQTNYTTEPNPRTSWCQTFDWKGNGTRVVENCDVLKDEIKVKLFRLTNKSECINYADLSIQGEWMETWYNTKAEQKRIVHFQNTFKDLQSITSNSRVEVVFRATLLQNNLDMKEFKTQFLLDTRNCSTRNGLPIGVGSTTVCLISIVAIIGCHLKKKRGEQKKNANLTPVKTDDENPIYGTYSRGLDGEGDYGDGDKVYVTDTNDYYAVG